MEIPKLDETDRPDLALGGAIYLLLFSPSRWIQRRVESASFLDAWSMRRRVSVDFEVPGRELTAYEVMPCVPLALLEKEVLINFDLVDDDGRILPLLTREQNSFIAWSALARVAEFAVRESRGRRASLDESLLADLRIIASADWDDPVAEVDRLMSDTKRSPLRESPFFMDLAYDLAWQFLLLVPVEEKPPSRRIVKFSYTQELEPRPGKSVARFLGRMGWAPARFDFSVPSVGQCSSFHFEFSPPRGLGVADARLNVYDPANRDHSVQAEVAGNHVHAYVARQSEVAYGVMSVWLWPERAGLLRSGVAVGILTTSVLLFFLISGKLLNLSSDTATALLLAIPGLIAGFIVRPWEHGMVTDLVRGIRYQIAGIGLSAYLAALSVVSNLSDDYLFWTWAALAAISGLFSASLLVSYVGLLPKRMLESDATDKLESGEHNG